MVSGSIVGLVLAAGESSRFGGLKQNFRIDGKTLLGRAVDALGDAGCEAVFVVTGAEAEALENDWERRGVRLVHNPSWREGMGGSIACGVSAVLEAVDGVAALVVAVCDQPELDAALVRRLIGRYAEGEQGAVACEYDGRPGVPAIFGKRWFDRLVELRGDEGARKLLRAPDSAATISWPEGAIDIDRASDVERFS